jgi:hypothetical protein
MYNNWRIAYSESIVAKALESVERGSESKAYRKATVAHEIIEIIS